MVSEYICYDETKKKALCRQKKTEWFKLEEKENM